jgi:O-antigen ligase
VPVRRLGLAGIGIAAVAAVAGPNLAAPGAPWLFAFRVLAILIGLGLVAYVLMDGRLTLPARVPRPAALLGVLIAWSALSLGWAEDPIAAIRWTTFLAMMSALAIGIAMLASEPRRARRLLWALAATWAVACLVGAAEITTGLTLPTARDVTGGFGAASLFGNENNFAVYLTLCLPWFLALPVVYRDVRLRLLGVAGAVVSIGFMLASGSKASLLALGLMLIALLLLVGTDRRGGGRLVAAGAIAALSVALVVPSVLGFGVLPERTVTKLDFGLLLDQVQQEQGSGAVRTNLLEDGLALVGESGGLGVGAGNAEVRVRGLADFPGVGNLHNWWLEVLVDGGIVALAIYVAFYLLLWRGQVRAARRGTSRLVRYTGTAGTLALTGWVVGSLGPSTAIHFAPMWITFGLAMATLALAARETGEETRG